MGKPFGFAKMASRTAFLVLLAVPFTLMGCADSSGAQATLTGADLSDMEWEMETAAPPCPSCGSHDTATIVYGLPLPAGENETFDRELRAGIVILGGCTLTGNDPLYHCNDCTYKWGQFVQ